MSEQMEGRLARRRKQASLKVARWIIVLATVVAFLTGTAGGFIYRSGYQGRGGLEGSPQLQPLPLPVILKGGDEPWAAVLRVQPRGAGGSREGTGFFIDQSGHFVTAAHVVEGEECVTLLDQNGRKYEGSVLGRDRLLDIALVRVAVPGAPRAFLPVSDPAEPASGRRVAVAHLVTGNVPVEQQGEIQRIGLAVTVDGRYMQGLTELKGVEAAPGMSGGPVIDLQSGKAMGLLIAGTEVGDGYAIPFTHSAGRLREWGALPTPAGCAQPIIATQTSLQLATITPLSGLLGVWGADVADGVALAIREMEADLQKAGYRVTLRRIDDAGNAVEAKEQAALVAADPQVIGVIGSLTNPLSEAVHVGLAKGSKVHIIPATPAEAPTEDAAHSVFRVVPAVQAQMVELLASIRQQRVVQRLVLLDDGSALGKARVELFSEVAKKTGVQVVSRISLTAELTGEQLGDRLRKAEPDLVYFGGGAAALRSVMAAFEGRPWLLAGGAELADRSFEALPHTVTEGMLFPYPVTAPPATFTARFESVLGKPTAGLSAYGYDSAMLILGALSTWGAEHPGQVPDGPTLARWIAEQSRYQGISGRIRFDAGGENTAAAIPIYRWSGGALEPMSKS